MEFTIEITKEVIDKSLMCGADNYDINISENCAFAVAYNELIPNVSVGPFYVYFGCKDLKNTIGYSKLTPEQKSFITRFDLLGDTPKERYRLVGRKFEVEIPDEVIDYWHGDHVKVAQKLVNSNILKPVNS